MPKIRTLAIFVILHLCSLTSSPAQDLFFNHITSADGLSQNHGLCIIQDHKGFMWFGTEDGLNRYDGYNITIYKNDPADTTSLSDNVILYLFEDNENNLWVATKGGLNKFNREQDSFERIEVNMVNGKATHFLTQEQDGDLWVATDNGIFLFIPETKTFKRYWIDEFPETVQVIYEDSEGNLWVGADNLYLFNKKSQTFTAFESNWVVSTIVEDDEQNLWVGFKGGGLKLFDKAKRKFTTSYLHDIRNKSSLGNNTIYTTYKDSGDNLWVGTENGGLNLFNPKEGSFKRYVNHSFNPYSISNNSVSAIYEDESGALWAGVHRGGINYSHPNQKKFSLYKKEAYKSSISNNNIKGFAETRDGNIWIATDGGGLNYWDRKTDEFEHITFDINNPDGISSDVVIAVFEDTDENLWVGTFNEGLNKYNPKTKTFKKYLHDPQDPSSIANNTAVHIYQDRAGEIWISSRGHGLIHYIKETDSFESYRVGSTPQNAISSSYLNATFEDSKGNFWIATSFGLNLFDRKNQKFSVFNHDEKNPESISYDDITCLFEDSKGRLWVGTKSGLNLMDPVSRTFKKYNKKNGLPNDGITSILEDNEGYLWIGTIMGLSKFDPDNETFKNFTVFDGLQSNEFSYNAVLKTKKGEMIFGGINGFNSFQPEKVEENTFIPPVVFTKFLVFNQEVKIGKNSILKKDISESKEITLSHKETVFTIEFAALNYILSAKNQYAYKLEGFDKDWNYVGNSRSATYTNLNPGTYTFKLKASNNDGIWNEEGTSLSIIIKPPYWKTWWFTTFVLFFIIGTAVNWYRVRTRDIHEQQKELEKQVKERTAEVVLQKEEILKQRQKMEDLYFDMKDSIRAAQIIQKSILPSEDDIKRWLPESFILNLPKDVVSGDFYWFNVINDNIIIAAVDCTGHGVAGAFMSINGHHLLNKAILNLNEPTASEILDRLNEELIHELHQKDNQLGMYDGMDAALCIIDKDKKKMQFAGANNPLYLLRDGVINQIKANKFSIGMSLTGNILKFTNNEIDLYAGDIIYLFSDGFADQIGGLDGAEKFMYPRFRDLLIKAGGEEMDVQLQFLHETIMDWRKNTQQLDDILVLGFKI